MDAMTKFLLGTVKDNLLNFVALLRSLGYASQIAGGLYIAGSLSLLGAIPLIIWGNKEPKDDDKQNIFQRNALSIHAYAGALTAIPLVFHGIVGFTKYQNAAYLEISAVGICLAIAYLIFKSKMPSSDSLFVMARRKLYTNKHQIGSLVLLFANIFQYHAGQTLNKGGLSLASIFFVAAMFTQFFVKTNTSKVSNKKVNLKLGNLTLHN